MLKEIKREFKAFIIIFCMLISFTMICVSDSATFSDVKNTSWYYDELMQLSELNIISGFPDGTFGGYNTLTKEQYIKLLVTAINQHKTYRKDTTYWFNPYMEYAKEIGIIETLGTQKEYSVNISREEISYLTYKVLDLGNTHDTAALSQAEKQNVEAKILDEKSISDKYKNAVYILYKKGILNGFSDSTFKPKETITRAQAVIVISNLINYRLELENRNYLDTEKIPGYVMKSKIDSDTEEEKFKVTQSVYGSDFSADITSILD